VCVCVCVIHIYCRVEDIMKAASVRLEFALQEIIFLGSFFADFQMRKFELERKGYGERRDTWHEDV